MELKKKLSNYKHSFFRIIYSNCTTNIQESNNLAHCLKELSNAFEEVDKERKPFDMNEIDWDADKLKIYENLIKIYKQVYNQMEQNAKKEMSKTLIEKILEPSDVKEI
ncbi:hypothetical protein M0R19_01780 [Candidatus Pacearchaeota archaeon]|nr:hypothetical protein [Candidatus Pacearchaeota archaeon]